MSQLDHKLLRIRFSPARQTAKNNLLAKWVIHTVGSVWRGGQYYEHELLAKCYRSSLALAVQNSVRAIAFPAISTGVYRFPLNRATQIAVAEVKNFLAQNSSIEQVRFVCFGEAAYQEYLATLSWSDRSSSSRDQSIRD